MADSDGREGRLGLEALWRGCPSEVQIQERWRSVVGAVPVRVDFVVRALAAGGCQTWTVASATDNKVR